MRSAHPCIVRPAPGSSTPGDSGNCDFSVLVPKVYGPDLWALPLVNESGVDVDISCCVFVFGDSPNRIFLPPVTVAGAGDTLFLTNSLSLFQAEFPVRTAFGNCASSAPGSGTLTMLGPDWGQLWTRPVPAQMEEHLASSPLMVTEINCMPSQEYNCGDWVEFYNPGDTIIDIGGFSLRDSEGNRCIVPMNTVVEPGGFRVLVREQYLFQSCFSVCDVSVPGLGFGLDSQFDSLSVYDRSGRLLLCVDWDMEAFHPSGRAGVLGLVAPGLSLWELAPFPGTPGEPNRLWDAGGASLNLTSVFPNPTLSGSISFEYTTTTWPVRAFVMDLSGRIVVDMGVLDQVGGSHCVEMPGNTSAGIYFLVLQSCGGITAGRFTSL